METLETVITQFIDLKISIDVAQSSSAQGASSEQILAQLDRVYAAQRKMKAVIQRKQRRQLAQLQPQQAAATTDDGPADDDESFPLEQLKSILADMDDVAHQLDQRLVAREARNVPIDNNAHNTNTTTNDTANHHQHQQQQHVYDNSSLPPLPQPPSSHPNDPAAAAVASPAVVVAAIADTSAAAGAEANPLLSNNKDDSTDEWSGWGALEINANEIRFDPERDFLGKGSFGRVYAGRCRGKEVAVKVPVKQQLSDKDLAAFRHEVLMMSKIFHPNVCLFMGATTSQGNFRIVSELLHTDVERLLRSEQELSLHERVRMAKDAALGVNWLHGISGIIHRDLKPANLLVDSNLTVKLTDFGFAQLRPESEDETLEDGRGGAKGTPLWMAPEIMMGKPFTEKVDVYSFGIILWQILTRQEPFAHHKNLKLFRIAVCKRGERPPMPPDAPPRLRQLIEACWDGDSNRRPPFKKIVHQLDDVLLDAVVDDAVGADFWRKYFGRTELRTSVPWREFAYTLLHAVNDGVGEPALLSESSDAAAASESDASSRVPMPLADAVGDAALDAAAAQLAFFEQLLATRETQKAKGDAIVVTMHRFCTNIKWFGRFFEPGAHSIIEMVKVLQTKPWFHGDVTKEDSEARLSCRMDGTFLVRLSATTPGCPYTISMINNQHRRILHEGPGKPYFVKGSSHAYTSLVELIETCRELSLVVPCPHNSIGWGYQGAIADE
jgi:serine/threonine protein kinase